MIKIMAILSALSLSLAQASKLHQDLVVEYLEEQFHQVRKFEEKVMDFHFNFCIH